MVVLCDTIKAAVFRKEMIVSQVSFRGETVDDPKHELIYNVSSLEWKNDSRTGFTPDVKKWFISSFHMTK